MQVVEELKSRKAKLAERINSLRAESEECWKSLEAAEKSLNEMVSSADYDTTRYFVEEESARAERAEREAGSAVSRREERQETEQFYLHKFREYILNSNRLARLTAKYEHIRAVLGDQSGAAVPSRTLPRPSGNTRKRIGRTLLGGQPKLFGGSLEEYLEHSHQDIPQIIKSSVRIINLYGLHHQVCIVLVVLPLVILTVYSNDILVIPRASSVCRAARLRSTTSGRPSSGARTRFRT